MLTAFGTPQFSVRNVVTISYQFLPFVLVFRRFKLYLAFPGWKRDYFDCYLSHQIFSSRADSTKKRCLSEIMKNFRLTPLTTCWKTTGTLRKICTKDFTKLCGIFYLLDNKMPSQSNVKIIPKYFSREIQDRTVSCLEMETLILSLGT